MIRPTIFDPVRAQRTVSVSYLWTINIAKWIARRMGYDVWQYSTTASIIHDLSMQREWWHTQWLVESVFDVYLLQKKHMLRCVKYFESLSIWEMVATAVTDEKILALQSIINTIKFHFTNQHEIIDTIGGRWQFKIHKIKKEQKISQV